LKLKDDTPAIFISREGAEKALKAYLGTPKGHRVIETYTAPHKGGYRATYVMKKTYDARYITNDEADTLVVD
jgi:hypothetical protein